MHTYACMHTHIHTYIYMHIIHVWSWESVHPVQRDETNAMAITRTSEKCANSVQNRPDGSWKVHQKYAKYLLQTILYSHTLTLTHTQGVLCCKGRGLGGLPVGRRAAAEGGHVRCTPKASREHVKERHRVGYRRVGLYALAIIVPDKLDSTGCADFPAFCSSSTWTESEGSRQYFVSFQRIFSERYLVARPRWIHFSSSRCTGWTWFSCFQTDRCLEILIATIGLVT